MTAHPFTRLHRHESELARMFRRIKSEPNSTYEELMEVSGWKREPVVRVLRVLEVWGAIEREQLYDSRADKVTTVVRTRGDVPPTKRRARGG